ncbi:molybdopterin-synthase adenylyltransferase MoeB [Winogradskyella jejuensis]|uniref:Molybdopterin-synthase adenylyltransferase n=1 Tax=Winogradskyella jejuensis TaxID=1089305 RepID=A0A1M5KSI8_9FLAO|nr:molybdopterin-synthase adenylyltransferase MoeB [Winogradskyella jejuensis]SHG55754.1 adenylyltransferase and sulfurtransferase [Winogradskyella jejuensis]
MSRYSRHISLQEIGREGQEKINASKVLVVGAGGLGCPVLQYLAAAGIGTIGVVDFDMVEESNLQRQILFGNTSLGRNKAAVAKEVLSNLNPTIAIHPYTEKLSPENVVSIFEAYDIIVDATDNFASRYLINDAAIVLNKPLVYGAIYKFEGQVTVFNHNNGPSYRCVFPNPPEKGTMPNCSEVGVLGVLPGIIGTLQANEVLKLVLDIGDTLSGKMYCFNALTNQSNTLRFHRNELEIEIVKARGKQFEVLDSSFFCSTDIPEIELKAIAEEDVLFIDVREYTEQPRISLENVIEIPLASLEENIESIPTHKKIIAFCKSGMRSKQAVSILKQHHILNCYSLKYGVNAFAKAELKTI